MNEDLQNYLNEIRRDFSGQPLNKSSVADNPFDQFNKWFEEAVNGQLLDPYAMSLTTVSADGQPSTRIVYMRGIADEGFIFYSNYSSSKASDLLENNKVALNFFWGPLERQIRVEGCVSKVSDEVSDKYFAARPRESQIGAWASDQSATIQSREELEAKVKEYTDKFDGQEVPRPTDWGGYLVKPTRIEFWQGRPNRLHDRISYALDGDKWSTSRLSP